MISVRNLTVSAMITSLAYIFLCAAGIVPIGRLVFLCLATASVCIVVMECGRVLGIISSVVLMALAYFFVPNITVKILFICFFSYYPIVKSFLERGEGLTVEWIIKVVYFALIIFLVSVIGKQFDLIPEQLLTFTRTFKRTLFVYGLLIAAASLFDFALSNIIEFYGRKIMPKTNINIVPEFESEFDDDDDFSEE